MPSRSKTGGTVRGVDPRFPTTLSRANQSRISRYSASAIARKPLSLLRLPLRLACGPNGSLRSSIGTGARNALKGAQGETKKRRGHHASRPKRPPLGSPAWSLDRNQNANSYATPPPRGLSTWSDDQIAHATIRSASDGDKPRRDGELARLACWLRLSSDGDEPRRNEHCRPTGTSPVETNTASRRA